MTLELSKEVARNTQQLAEHGRRIGIVEEDNRTFSRLTALFERQMEQSEEKDKEHQKRIEKQTEVLNKIDNNLNLLYQSQKELKDEFVEVKDRVGQLEEGRTGRLENYKEKSIDFYLKVLAGIVVAGALVYLGLK